MLNKLVPRALWKSLVDFDVLTSLKSERQMTDYCVELGLVDEDSYLEQARLSDELLMATGNGKVGSIVIMLKGAKGGALGRERTQRGSWNQDGQTDC